MRITLLINDLLLGGAQKMVLDLAHAYMKHGHDVCVLTLKDESQFPDTKTFYALLQARVIRVRGGPRFSFTEAFDLYHALKQERPDILHTHLPYAGIVGRVVGRLAGIRHIVSTQHNVPPPRFSKSYILERLTFPFARMITAVNAETEKAYFGSYIFADPQQAFRTGHMTIYNGVDFERFYALPRAFQRPVTVGSVARLLPWKGHDMLIQGFAKLHAEIPETQLRIVGWGPDEDRLRDLIQSLDLVSSVELLGARDDIPQFLQEIDIFALTYRETTFNITGNPGISILEAMASGKPVVTSYFSGMERTLANNVDALCVPQNDPEAVYQALLFLIAHPEQALDMAQKGQEKTREQYSMTKTVTEYLDLYTHLFSSI